MRYWMALLLCLIGGLSHSSTTKFWVTSTQEDFLKGETQNVTVGSGGEVSISPKLELIADTKEKFIWCVTHDPDGNLYFGTGDEGKIFKIAKSGHMELFCDLDEPEVLSLFFRRPYLYAGTGPSGIIYRIDSGGRVEKYFDTEEKYVWDISSNAKSDIYVATGEKGKIYRISAKGKAQLIYESSDPNITRLGWSDGKLYATTSGSGKIYEIPKDGKPRVIYQTEEEEILAFEIEEEGILWVGANSKDNSVSSVYRVDPDGTARKVWSCPDSAIYSFTLWNEKLLVGTGSGGPSENQGKIYALDAEGNSTLLIKCDDSAVLCLTKPDGVWVGTGNLGRVYRLWETLSKEGVIISETYDTEGLSSWGRISWEAEIKSGTRVELFTRSGNSKKVDDTWSDWSGPYANNAKIESPDARFIQWKAVLRGTSKSSPSLKEVKIPYLQKNMAPQIDDISIEDDLEAKVKHISWEASDPNEDSLLYDLWFKAVDEKRWKLLKEDITETEYELESALLPDGVYLIKVSAKDSPENPENLSLSGEKTSQPFIVDNTPPRVMIYSIKKEESELRIEAKVVDEATPIRTCRYSVDAGDWRYLAPDDGIFDSTEEKFSFSITKLPEGEHLLVVRGEDGQGNQAMARKIVKIP